MKVTLEDLHTTKRVIEEITVPAWVEEANQVCLSVQLVHQSIVRAIAEKTAEAANVPNP